MATYLKDIGVKKVYDAETELYHLENEDGTIIVDGFSYVDDYIQHNGILYGQDAEGKRRLVFIYDYLEDLDDEE